MANVGRAWVKVTASLQPPLASIPTTVPGRRVKLAQERTRSVNTLRALVYNFNLQIKRGSLSKASREKIRALSMGLGLERERDELLDRIEELEKRIRELQKEIEGWAAQESEPFG